MRGTRLGSQVVAAQWVQAEWWGTALHYCAKAGIPELVDALLAVDAIEVVRGSLLGLVVRVSGAGQPWWQRVMVCSGLLPEPGAKFAADAAAGLL